MSFPADVDPETDKVASKTRAAAEVVAQHLGRGPLEKAYRPCLAKELRYPGMHVQESVELPLKDRTLNVKNAYEIDILVEDRVVVEVKSTIEHHPAFEAQTLSDLRWSRKEVGLLVNFG